MKLGATHTPSFVRILCTVLVTGSTHAASLDSNVVNPDHFNALDNNRTLRRNPNLIPGCMVSNIFFLGLSCGSGVASNSECRVYGLVSVALTRESCATYFRTSLPRSRLVRQASNQAGAELALCRRPFHPYV